MRQVHGKEQIRIEKKYVLVLALLGALILAYVLVPRAAPVKSVEVSFTDTSAGGMEIVPASCASAPPPGSGDGHGYQVPTVSGAEIYNQYSYFCITNTSGNTYFVPANTAAEINSFLSVEGGLPGLSVQNPGPDSP
jgi:hypothetical protein